LYFLWSLMRQFKIRTGSTDNYLKQAGTEKSFNSEGITTLKLLKFGELNANWDGIEKQIHKEVGGTKGFEKKIGSGSKSFGAVDFASRFIIMIENINFKFRIY
jgi:hypothetical protein